MVGARYTWWARNLKNKNKNKNHDQLAIAGLQQD
jgi:hypothetical protein